MKDFNEIFENIKNFITGKQESNNDINATYLQEMSDQELVDFLDSTWSADSLNRIARS